MRGEKRKRGENGSIKKRRTRVEKWKFVHDKLECGMGGGEKKRILYKRHQFRSAFCLSASEIEKEERKKCEG